MIFFTLRTIFLFFALVPTRVSQLSWLRGWCLAKSTCWKGSFAKKKHMNSLPVVLTQYKVCERWVKAETSSRGKLPYLNIWICMRFQISKLFFFFFAFQIHTCCLYSCPTLCMYLTINNSQEFFIFYLVTISYHQTQRALRLVWSWLFFWQVSWVRGLERDQTTLSDTDSVWNLSRLHSLQGLWVSATLTVLFCCDPGLALNSFLDDQWFCCKRWLMNNNMFSSKVN